MNLIRFRRKDGITIGNKTVISSNTCISNRCNGGGGVIKIDDDCRIGVREKSYFAGHAGQTKIYIWGNDAEIVIGKRCVLNGVTISARKSIRIGDDCIFAGGIQILDSDTHKICSRNRIYDLDEPDSVSIGKNVWIGLNAIILKGSVIGDNSVIGAGAIVKGVFPDNCVIAGNPAKIVKTFRIEDP